MPEQKEKTVPTNPSPSFFQRFFGSDKFTPEIQEGINIARKENPSLAEIKPYGPLTRMFLPQAQGWTSPARNIYLNATQLAGSSPEDIADTITHEQAHVNQMNERGYGTLRELFSQMSEGNLPYGQRPDEMAAFQAEKERRAKSGRMQTAVPSFSNPGQYYVPMDVNLPLERKR